PRPPKRGWNRRPECRGDDGRTTAGTLRQEARRGRVRDPGLATRADGARRLPPGVVRRARGGGRLPGDLPGPGAERRDEPKAGLAGQVAPRGRLPDRDEGQTEGTTTGLRGAGRGNGSHRRRRRPEPTRAAADPARRGQPFTGEVPGANRALLL